MIRDSRENGKYLVFKSKRWNCWLFPNYHCLNAIFSKAKELKYITECIKRDLKISEEIEFKYIGNNISEKYSVGDKVRKNIIFITFKQRILRLILIINEHFIVMGKSIVGRLWIKCILIKIL